MKQATLILPASLFHGQCKYRQVMQRSSINYRVYVRYGKTIMKDELGEMWEEASVDCLKGLYQHLLGVTEEKNRKPYSEYPVT